MEGGKRGRRIEERRQEGGGEKEAGLEVGNEKRMKEGRVELGAEGCREEGGMEGSRTEWDQRQ